MTAKVTNTFLQGEAAANPSIEDLRERYAFLPKIMNKFPGYDDPDLIDKALHRYHQHLENTATATFGPEDVPGWRLMILQRQGDGVQFAGVRDDGFLEQGVVRTRDGTSLSRVPARTIADKIVEYAKDPEWDGRLVEEGPEDHLFSIWEPRETDHDLQFSEWTWLPLNPYSKHVTDAVRDGAQMTASSMASFVERVRRGETHEEHQDIEWGEMDPEATPPLFGGDDDLDDEAIGEQLAEVDFDEAIDDKKENDHFFKLFQVAYTKSLGRRQGAMAANCMRALNKETQSVLHAILEPNLQAANYVTGVVADQSGRLVVDPIIARNRQQAIKSYPFLAKEFIDYRYEGLGKLIDEGGELSRHLCDRYKVPPAVVRRLSGLTWQKIGRYAHEFPARFVGYAGKVDINHLPTTRKGFAEFRAAMDAANIVANETSADRNQMAASIGGRFDSYAKLLEGNPAQGVKDMRTDLENRLLRPAIAQIARAEGKTDTEAFHVAKNTTSHLDTALAGNRSLINVIQGHNLRSALTASQRWHRAVPRIAETVGDGSQFVDPRAREWAGLVGEHSLGSGVTAVELTSLAALRQEGLRQNHCVGGYGKAVKDGRSLIFSLRKGENIISTIEIAVEESKNGGTNFSIAQNYGRANEKPGKPAELAARALLRAVKKVPAQDLSNYKSNLSEVRHASEGESLNELAGFDVFDRKGLETAFTTLREFLPKADGKLSLDQWIAKKVEPALGAKALPRTQDHQRNASLEH